MSRPFVGRTIGGVDREAVGGNEAQGRDEALAAVCNEVVSEIHSGELNGKGIGIVEFNEVLLVERDLVSEPFVNLELRLVASPLGDVRSAESRNGQRPGAIAEPADGEIGQLRAEGNGVH